MQDMGSRAAPAAAYFTAKTSKPSRNGWGESITFHLHNTPAAKRKQYDAHILTLSERVMEEPWGHSLSTVKVSESHKVVRPSLQRVAAFYSDGCGCVRSWQCVADRQACSELYKVEESQTYNAA